MVKQRKYTGSVAGSNPVLPKHFSVAVPKRGHIWPRNKWLECSSSLARAQRLVSATHTCRAKINQKKVRAFPSGLVTPRREERGRES